MDWREALFGIGAAIFITMMMLVNARYTFNNGRIVERDLNEYKYNEKMNTVAVLAAICATGAFILEYIVWHVDIIMSLRWAAATSLIIFVAWTDYKDNKIPNTIVLIAVICSLVFGLCDIVVNTLAWKSTIGSMLVGAAACGGPFLIVRILTHGGVGFGDIKLYLTLGMLLGFRGCFNVMLYTLLTAFFVSVIALLMKKKSVNDTLPIGPFTLVGMILSLMFGA